MGGWRARRFGFSADHTGLRRRTAALAGCWFLRFCSGALPLSASRGQNLPLLGKATLFRWHACHYRQTAAFGYLPRVRLVEPTAALDVFSAVLPTLLDGHRQTVDLLR